jgi:hypothetical protein
MPCPTFDFGNLLDVFLRLPPVTGWVHCLIICNSVRTARRSRLLVIEMRVCEPQSLSTPNTTTMLTPQNEKLVPFTQRATRTRAPTVDQFLETQGHLVGESFYFRFLARNETFLPFFVLKLTRLMGKESQLRPNNDCRTTTLANLLSQHDQFDPLVRCYEKPNLS